MRKKATLILLLLAALWLPAAGQAAAPDSPPIRVGIWANQVNIRVAASTEYSLVDTGSRKVLGKFKAGEKALLSTKDARMTVNGTPVEAREIKLVLAKPGTAEVNSRSYRGEITIHRTKGKSGLTVVDTLPLEEYLYGIIATEISPEWPADAVRAQAVASRTYSLYNLGKHSDDGFDLCAGTDCQVYGGKDKEDPRAIRAVDETKGLAVTYQGKPIPAFFHSSGGGYTENSENVWGTYFPFLRGVPDFDQKSPQFKWEKKLTPADLEDALASAGVSVGKLQTIELSPLTKPPVAGSPDRGVSGRVKKLRFTGTNGSVELTGTKFRTILGLNSTLFDLQVVLPAEKAVEFEITDNYGSRDKKKVEINVPPAPERRLPTDKPAIRRIGGRPNEMIVITGAGWGHGVGLSQWGAKAMAEKAPRGDAAYFKEILKHYYPGTAIEKIY